MLTDRVRTADVQLCLRPLNRCIGFAMKSSAFSDPYADALKRMTPEAKMAVAKGLRETAWELTAAGVRLREPDLNEDEVQQRVRDIFLRVVS